MDKGKVCTAEFWELSSLWVAEEICNRCPNPALSQPFSSSNLGGYSPPPLGCVRFHRLGCWLLALLGCPARHLRLRVVFTSPRNPCPFLGHQVCITGFPTVHVSEFLRDEVLATFGFGTSVNLPRLTKEQSQLSRHSSNPRSTQHTSSSQKTILEIMLMCLVHAPTRRPVNIFQFFWDIPA